MPNKEVIHAIYEPKGAVAIRTACGRETSVIREGKGTLTFVDVRDEGVRDKVNCSGCLNVTRSRPDSVGGWATEEYHYQFAF